jgi:hypothetical protein
VIWTMDGTTIIAGAILAELWQRLAFGLSNVLFAREAVMRDETQKGGGGEWAEQFVRVPESHTVPTMAREMRKHGSLGKGNAIESPVGPGCKARRGLYQVRD